LPGEAGEELHLSPIGPEGDCTVIDAGGPIRLAMREIAPGRWRLDHGGETLTLSASRRRDLVELRTPAGRHLFQAAPPLGFAAAETAHEGLLTSPLTGAIVKILAAEGDSVAAGDTVAVLES